MGRRLWRSRLDLVTAMLLGALVLIQVAWAVIGTFYLPEVIGSRQGMLNSAVGVGVWTLVSVWVVTRWEGIRRRWLLASGICAVGFLIQLKPPVVLADYLPLWGSLFLPYTLLAILLSCLVIYLVPVKHDAAGIRRWRLHPWAAPGAALGLLIIPLWFLGNIFYLVAVPPGTNFTGDMAVAWETTLKAGRLEFISLEEPELLVKADDRLSSINTGTGRINWQTDLTWASREVFWQKAGDRAWVVAAVSGGWAAAVSRTDGKKLWERRDLERFRGSHAILATPSKVFCLPDVWPAYPNPDQPIPEAERPRGYTYAVIDLASGRTDYSGTIKPPPGLQVVPHPQADRADAQLVRGGNGEVGIVGRFFPATPRRHLSYLYVFDPDTGKLTWRVYIGGPGATDYVAGLFPRDLGFSRGHVAYVTVKDKRWAVRVRKVDPSDPQSGRSEVAWEWVSNDPAGGDQPFLKVVKDVVFFGDKYTESADGLTKSALRAFDLFTGRQLWRQDNWWPDYDEPVADSGETTFTYARAGTPAGSTRGLEVRAIDRQGRTKWSYPMPWPIFDLTWMPSWGTGPDTTGPALRIVTSQYYSPAAKYLDHYLILDAQTGARVLAQTAAGRHFASYRYDCFHGFRGLRTVGEDILVRAQGPPPAVPYILPGLASICLRAEERNIERLGGGLADYLKLMGKWVPVMKLPMRIGSELSSVLPTPRMVIVSGQKDGQYCLYGLRYVGNGT